MTGIDLIVAAFLVTRTVAPPDTFAVGPLQVIAVPDQALFPGSLFYNNCGSSLVSNDPPPTGHDGVQNTGVGKNALCAVTTGYNDTAVGFNAAPVLTTGYWDTAIGLRALYFTTTGHENTAIGAESLYGNVSGSQNTAAGSKALRALATGDNNVATGFEALLSANNAWYNTATGHSALRSNVTGSFNVADGMHALYFKTSGDMNTSVGTYSLRENLTGSRNIAIGYSAGRHATGSDLLFIDNRDRGTEANERALALVWGVLGTTVNDQSFGVNAKHNSFKLANYPDNATALAAGLVVGDLYHTDGVVKVVY